MCSNLDSVSLQRERGMWVLPVLKQLCLVWVIVFDLADIASKACVNWRALVVV